MTDPTHNVTAFRAARDWAQQHGHQQPDDRMLSAYGRALLASLGRCGDALPAFGPASPTSSCELPSGHGGLHRDGPTEWTQWTADKPGACPCTCHQPDRCPCKPGAPQHRHGAGGYCTVGDPVPADARPASEHVIAFAADGTWSLEHPASCQPSAVSRVPRPDPVLWDCQVRQLAERQITSDLAQLVAGGRYTCSAGTLGDVFQLGERLHDDQCTQPVCAACGCFCHSEHVAEG